MGSVPWAGGVRDDKWQQSRAEKTWAAGAAAARGTHAAQEEVVQHVVEVTQSETVVAQGRWPRAPAERAASSPRPRGARPLRDPGRAQGGGARGLVLPARVVAGLNSVRFGFGG